MIDTGMNFNEFWERAATEKDFPCDMVARTCEKCGYVTQETQTHRCVLCKTPFSATSADSDEKTANTNAASKRTEKSPPIKRDDRSWLVKSIHGRSVGGIVLSILMIVGGLVGGGMIRANMTVTGTPLTLIGIVTLIFALLLFFATKRR